VATSFFPAACNCLLRSESSSRPTIFALMPFPLPENYALNAQKGAEKFQKDLDGLLAIELFATKSVVGLYGRFGSSLSEMKARETFHISRKPVVPLAETEESHDLGNRLGLPRFHDAPRLLAIARDPWTIFAYWNVDWP